MKSKLINQRTDETTYVLIFDAGDEAVAGLASFAKENRLGASHFTGIGGFESATLGYFEIEKKNYKEIPISEQVEVLSLVGDIALQKGKPKVHVHTVVGTCEGLARGGHLLAAIVRPTLEIIITESPKHLHREFDDTTGLALIRL
ncbi:MAG: PPC domain-containing DNA-binding protein [Terriglobia bacterium]